MIIQSRHFKRSSKYWNPHRYQKKGVKFLLEHAAGALFFDPGLGKTAVTLAALKILKGMQDDGVLGKVLIIAPHRVCHSVWPNELSKWEDFKGLTYEVLHGKCKEDLLQNSDADIFIINPEGLGWLLGIEKVPLPSGKFKVTIDEKRWKELGFDTLIIDELSKFKNTNSIRYKAMRLVIDSFSRRWGLTGSPASNGLLYLFGQCFMLDQGRTFGRFVTHYREKYFYEGRDGFTWKLKEGADKLIYERLKPLALRMGEDVLDMPKLVENNIMVSLPDKALKIYKELEDHLITQIDDGVVTAKTTAVASLKCRQVASGGIYLDPDVEALVKLPSSDRTWVEIHSAKLDALEELIGELQGSPLLVAFDFKHDLERIKKRFGKSVPVIGGGVSVKAASKIEKAWNKGELPVLFGHPQSMGHGLNLQESGNHVAWFSLTWDYELYDQLNRRVRRQGNTAKRVFVHHIIAEGTIDESILSVLKLKRSGQNALFRALKKRARGCK